VAGGYFPTPVLDLGASGKFDESHVVRPCVLKVGDEYFMYYTGRDSSNNWQIGLAIRSDSPLGVFTRYSTDPIIPKGSEGTYDTQRTMGFSVIYDRVNEKFIGWYEGRISSTQRYIIKCESTDGKTWTGFTKVYDLDSNDSQPWVLRVGSLYYLAYFDGATNTCHLLTSNDGVTWEDYGEIIGLGSGGEWDDTKVLYCTVFWSMGIWYAIYQGIDASDKRRIGMATSSDGFNYTKYPKNPILALGEEDDLDDTRLTAPTSILYDDGVYYLWYVGYSDVEVTYRIFLAYMPW